MPAGKLYASPLPVLGTGDRRESSGVPWWGCAPLRNKLVRYAAKPFRIRKIIHLDAFGGSDPELTNTVEFFSEYLDDLGGEVSLKMDEVATKVATVSGKPITELTLRYTPSLSSCLGCDRLPGPR